MLNVQRYRFHLAYNGQQFSGWQRQPDARTVQQTIEEALSKRCRQPITIVGCGRTDAGVHASSYYCHADLPEGVGPDIGQRINRMMPEDIVIYDASPVSDDWHARYSATLRSYRYDVTSVRDVFHRHTKTFYPRWDELDQGAMQAAAKLLLDYESFAPFCKTGSDTQHMRCAMSVSQWDYHETGGSYHISANRFLRGMVRLIVGACLSVGHGILSLDDLHHALMDQAALTRAYSAPPDGLYLTQISYD